MKINYSSYKTISFNQLSTGEVFEIHNELYMKTEPLDDLVNAVRLSDGHLSHIGTELSVILKTAELTVLK